MGQFDDDLLLGTIGGSSTTLPGSKDARSETRKRFAGKVKIYLQGQPVNAGRLFDISMTGVSVILENIIAKKPYTLEVDVFHDGKRYFFTVQGMPMYNILVSGKGYKIGFQFGPPGATMPPELGHLMEAS